jgi:hypothetical protein
MCNVYLLTRDFLPDIFSSEYAKVRVNMLKFWEEGDPKVEWLTITEDEMVMTLPTNRDPLPEGGVQKRPPLVRSGSC